MEQGTLVKLTENEWDDFEKNHLQGSMTQSYTQYQLLQKRGRSVELLGIKEKDTVIAGALVTFDAIHGGEVVTIEHGPLLDYQDAGLMKRYFEGLKEHTLKRKGLFIRFSPNLVYQAFDNAGNALTDADDTQLKLIESIGAKHTGFKTGMVTDSALRWQYTKNVQDMDIASLEASYDKNVKYYLKKNKQFGIQIRQLQREELPAFKKLTLDTAERIGFHDKDLDFYQMVFDTYGDTAKFMVAELNFRQYIQEEHSVIEQLDQKLDVLRERLQIKETKKNRRQYEEFDDQKKQHVKRIEKVQGLFNNDVPDEKKIIAGALFVEQPQEMTYLYSGMYNQYKDYYGPYLLQDTMLKQTITDNIPTYNFLGITGDFDGHDGVFKFKTEFNGQAEELIGEFVYPVRPVKFKGYQLMKKALGRENN